jgi:hypothetical protein
VLANRLVDGPLDHKVQIDNTIAAYTAQADKLVQAAQAQPAVGGDAQRGTAGSANNNWQQTH